MSFDAHKNFSQSLVATAPSPALSGTSLVVTAGEGVLLPAAPFNGVVCPAGDIPTVANAEIVRCTAKATDTLTITRAQEGTAARTIVVGDQFIAGYTALTLTDIETAAIGGGWELVTARTMTGQIQENFTNLSGYSKLMILVKLVTKGTSGAFRFRVSVDNGANYLAASGDYLRITPADGTEVNDNGVTMQLTNATAARSGWAIIEPFNVNGTIKLVRAGPVALIPSDFIVNTNPYNAVRVYAQTIAGGNPSALMNAGTIYILGKR